MMKRTRSSARIRALGEAKEVEEKEKDVQVVVGSKTQQGGNLKRKTKANETTKKNLNQRKGNDNAANEKETSIGGKTQQDGNMKRKTKANETTKNNLNKRKGNDDAGNEMETPIRNKRRKVVRVQKEKEKDDDQEEEQEEENVGENKQQNELKKMSTSKETTKKKDLNNSKANDKSSKRQTNNNRSRSISESTKVRKPPSSSKSSSSSSASGRELPQVQKNLNQRKGNDNAANEKETSIGGKTQQDGNMKRKTKANETTKNNLNKRKGNDDAGNEMETSIRNKRRKVVRVQKEKEKDDDQEEEQEEENVEENKHQNELKKMSTSKETTKKKDLNNSKANDKSSKRQTNNNRSRSISESTKVRKPLSSSKSSSSSSANGRELPQVHTESIEAGFTMFRKLGRLRILCKAIGSVGEDGIQVMYEDGKQEIVRKSHLLYRGEALRKNFVGTSTNLRRSPDEISEINALKLAIGLLDRKLTWNENPRLFLSKGVGKKKIVLNVAGETAGAVANEYAGVKARTLDWNNLPRGSQLAFCIYSIARNAIMRMEKKRGTSQSVDHIYCFRNLVWQMKGVPARSDSPVEQDYWAKLSPELRRSFKYLSSTVIGVLNKLSKDDAAPEDDRREFLLNKVVEVQVNHLRASVVKLEACIRARKRVTELEKKLFEERALREKLRLDAAKSLRDLILFPISSSPRDVSHASQDWQWWWNGTSLAFKDCGLAPSSTEGTGLPLEPTSREAQGPNAENSGVEEGIGLPLEITIGEAQGSNADNSGVDEGIGLPSEITSGEAQGSNAENSGVEEGIGLPLEITSEEAQGSNAENSEVEGNSSDCDISLSTFEK